MMPLRRRLALNALVAASLQPPRAADLRPDQIVRGIRARRSLSQRELADRSGVPLSTISRIETGSVQPRFDTLLRLMKATDVAFIVTDTGHAFEPIIEDPLGDRLRDAMGRRVPAHLTHWLIRSMWDPWSGWSRRGWTLQDETVPLHTYLGRRRDGQPLPAWWMSDVT